MGSLSVSLPASVSFFEGEKERTGKEKRTGVGKRGENRKREEQINVLEDTKMETTQSGQQTESPMKKNMETI